MVITKIKTKKEALRFVVVETTELQLASPQCEVYLNCLVTMCEFKQVTSFL